MRFSEDLLAVITGIGLVIAVICFIRDRGKTTSVLKAFTSGNVRNVVGMVGCAIYLVWYFLAK